MLVPPPPPSGPHTSTPTVASASRVYDFILGGSDNFAVDQVAASFLLRSFPLGSVAATYTRRFTQRVARFMARAGISQFIDLGSGLPTMGNVHEIVHAENPHARVVYVDYESYAVNTGRHMLADDEYATSILADISAPETVLDHPEVRDLIDFTKPVGLTMLSVLPFVPEERGVHRIVDQYKAPMSTGSMFGVSHASNDLLSATDVGQIRAFLGVYNRNVAENAVTRTIPEITRFFDGWDLVEPGVVPAADWHSDGDVIIRGDDMARLFQLGGVAVKP